jgi:exosome complex component RRP4
VGGGGWARREGEGTPGRSEGADGRPAPPEHVDREIVLPGDVLDFGRFKPGPGAYADGETVYAACLGIKTVRGDQMGVIPISGKYMPRVGDIVVGKVMEMTPGAWIIDLNSPYVAPLPGSETPWTVEFGETTKYMALGDTVIVQIKDVNEIGRVGVTMLGPDLRKVVGGQTMDVDATKVPRLIGRGGSMIGLLKRLTRCRILVGQNGRVWLDGTVEDVTVAMGAIRMIEQNAHRLGLTDAVANFIQGMRNKMDAGRAERERKNEAAEERAIINDRVQRTAESKDVQKVDDSNGVQRMDKMENEEE